MADGSSDINWCPELVEYDGTIDIDGQTYAVIFTLMAKENGDMEFDIMDINTSETILWLNADQHEIKEPFGTPIPMSQDEAE